MKKFLKEFKEFAMKGSMIDLAVGMIVGGAFTALVNSLVSNIFNPIIGLLTGGVDLSESLKVAISETVNAEGEVVTNYINFGAFLSALINFIIMAFVIFLFVKAINKLRTSMEKLEKKGEKEEDKEPTTKICPYCQSEISIKATRCPHCTSELK